MWYEKERVCAVIQLSINGRTIDRKKVQTSASMLGLAAGAIGWSGLANAASKETHARIMLLPDHYELTDGNVVVFKLETGEELTLNPDQYLIMQDGLLLITDELAQASIQSLPVMGSVRSELLRDLSEMSAPTESEVALATPEQARSILDGDAPRLFDDVSIERFELAQAVPSEDDEGNSGALIAGGATIIGGLIAAGIFGGDNPPEEPEPESEPSGPSYNDFVISLINELGQYIGESYMMMELGSAGDVDGDGKPDVLLGTSGSQVFPDETVYLVFGEDLYSRPSTLELGGDNVLKIKSTGERFGYAVSDAGDIDKDGYGDILIGDPNSGLTYLIFGSHLVEVKNSGNRSFDVAGLQPSQGIVVNHGTPDLYNFGRHVANAGDVDNDGIDDVLISSEHSSGASTTADAFLIFGKTLSDLKQNNKSEIDVATLDGNTGVRLEGYHHSVDRIGYLVSSAGNVDGDEYGDIIFGNKYAEEAYVIFGSHLASNPATVDLGNLTINEGIVISDVVNPDFTISMGAVHSGNIDGDAYTDLLVGYNGNAVIFGSHLNALKEAGGSNVVNDLSSGAGVTFDFGDSPGPKSLSGDVVGDVDGDGLDDISFDGGDTTDTIFIVFGSYLTGAKAVNQATLNISDLSGGKGVKLTGMAPDYVGHPGANFVGDIDADGKDDVLVITGVETYNPFDTKQWIVSGHTIHQASYGVGVVTPGVLDWSDDLGLI